MQFDYDYFLEQGLAGAEAFVQYLADTYQLELAPHVVELVIGSIAAGASYQDYAGTDALSALRALVAVREEAVVAVAAQCASVESVTLSRGRTSRRHSE